MDDEMIKLLAKKGGVIQITFGSMFVSGKVNKASADRRRHVREYAEANKLTGDQRKKYARQYLKGSITLGLEGTFNRMSRLAKSYLYRGKVETIQSIIEQIEAVQVDDIQRSAHELRDPARQTVTTVGPADETVLRNAINRTNLE